MNLPISLLCFALIVAPLTVSYFLFRKAGREALLARVPVFIECLLVFLYAGVFDLPLALPSGFEKLLGHSIWDLYHYSTRPDGIQVSETWLSARWWPPLRTTYLVLVLIGIVWAIANLIKRRGIKLNLLAFSFGLLWLVVSFYFSLACFPFCF